MTYRGHLKDGVAIPDTPTNLPDGTPVRIEVEGSNGNSAQITSVDDLANEQGVGVLRAVDELAGDWPPEDSVDEFLSYLREVRR